MASELQARELPDGRIELTLGRCVPVVLSLETYAVHTHRELFRLVGMLTLMAHYFTEEPTSCRCRPGGSSRTRPRSGSCSLRRGCRGFSASCPCPGSVLLNNSPDACPAGPPPPTPKSHV